MNINEDYNENEEFDNNEDEEIVFEELDCPIAGIFSANLNTPFNIFWPKEKMINFLKERGYKIINKYSEEDGNNIDIAVKLDQSLIPETENIKEVFNSEIQDILLKWLLKIGE